MTLVEQKESAVGAVLRSSLSAAQKVREIIRINKLIGIQYEQSNGTTLTSLHDDSDHPNAGVTSHSGDISTV